MAALQERFLPGNSSKHKFLAFVTTGLSFKSFLNSQATTTTDVDEVVLRKEPLVVSCLACSTFATNPMRIRSEVASSLLLIKS